MKCKLCGKNEPELLGCYCGRCDHIIGNVQSDLAAELGTSQEAVM